MRENDEVTASDCYHTYKCGECNLWSWCKDRLPVSKCKLCGERCTEEDLVCGVCKDCLTKAICPQTVKDYIADRADGDKKLWKSLFESYFSGPFDKCYIDRLSEKLQDTLMTQIMREFASDKLGNLFNSNEKLTSWIGEDDTAWEDFAEWLVKKMDAKN